MKKILAVCLLLMMVAPVVVFAQSPTPGPCRIGTVTTSGTSPQLGQCVSQIYLWALGAAGMLALLMMVVGGYYVMTASGNAKRATDGKSYLFSSLVGLLILLGAFLLLNTINPDLTCLKVDVGSIGSDTQSPPKPGC